MTGAVNVNSFIYSDSRISGGKCSVSTEQAYCPLSRYGQTPTSETHHQHLLQSTAGWAVQTSYHPSFMGYTLDSVSARHPEAMLSPLPSPSHTHTPRTHLWSAGCARSQQGPCRGAACSARCTAGTQQHPPAGAAAGGPAAPPGAPSQTCDKTAAPRLMSVKCV
jgi:hypothetical protein